MRPLYLWLLLLGPAGCGPADAPATQTPTRQPAPAPTKAPPVFDLPALARLNIDEVRATLGPVVGAETEPTREELADGLVEWAKQFRRDTTTLVVSYDVRTRQVIDFYVTTAHGRASSYAPWLRLVGVSAQDPRWSIEPFAQPGRPGLYLGVRVAAQ